MPLTNAGKEHIVENSWVTASLFIGLSADGSAEQTGHGYGRAALPVGSSNRDVSSAGVITWSGLPITIYTASDGSAEDSTHAALFDAAANGNQLTTWTALTNNPAAPANGQAYRLSGLTFTP